MTVASAGFVVPPDGGRSGTADRRRVARLDRDQTGHVAILTTTIRPGVLVPPHVHDREDETWYVISGVVMITLGDDLHRVPAGSTVWRPRGQPHASWVAPGDPDAQVLSVICPGGWEQRIIEFDRLTAEGRYDRQAFLAMAERNGVHWDFERGRAIAAEHGLRMMGDPA